MDDKQVALKQVTRFSTTAIASTVISFITLVTLIVWFGQDARLAAKRVHCRANFYQLGTMLRDYERRHGHFPAPVTYDADGRAMHSWRVEVLRSPQDQWVRGYDFSQPWDSPENLKFARENVPEFLQCPDVERDATTNYLLVIGPGCFYSSLDDQPTLCELDEGHPRIPLLAESSKSDILWTEPQDIEGTCETDIHSLPSVSGAHKDGAVVLFLEPSTGELVLERN